MKSNEVLRQTIHQYGSKAIADEMKMSASLIYKWCQPSEGADASGTPNPLDRLASLYARTRDPAPIAWLCRQANGFFVANPAPRQEGVPLVKAAQKLLKEFSELLEEVTTDIEDGRINAQEAEKIRREWEHLKTDAESFVVACENGVFGRAESRSE